MTVYAITDTKKGEQRLRLLIFKLSHISNLCLVDVLLHCSPDFVVHRFKIWTVRWPLFR